MQKLLLKIGRMKKRGMYDRFYLLSKDSHEIMTAYQIFQIVIYVLNPWLHVIVGDNRDSWICKIPRTKRLLVYFLGMKKTQ